MLDELAAENGWQFFHTENGAVFTPENLQRFRLIVLNHKSGTVWTSQQRQALQDYVEVGERCWRNMQLEVTKVTTGLGISNRCYAHNLLITQ